MYLSMLISFHKPCIWNIVQLMLVCLSLLVALEIKINSFIIHNYKISIFWRDLLKEHCSESNLLQHSHGMFCKSIARLVVAREPHTWQWLYVPSCMRKEILINHFRKTKQILNRLAYGPTYLWPHPLMYRCEDT